MIYQKTVLTSNGLELNAKMQAGGTGLALKYLAVGAGTTELTDKSTALTDQRQTFTFDKVEVDTADTKVIVATVTMNNKDLKVGYDIREMGIYATDPDVGDIMYAVINTEEGTDYDHFDAYTENAYEEIIMRIKIKTENADKVSFEFAPESMERKLEAYKVENQKALDNISKRIDTKANKTDLTTPFNFKGSILSTALPSSGNEVNDTYYCTDLQYRMTWNGTEWYQSSLDEAAYEDELSGLKSDLADFVTFRNDDDIMDLSWTDGYYLNHTSGSFGSNSSYSVTSKSVSSMRGNIPAIEPGTMYTVNHVGNLSYVFYDANYSRIEGYNIIASDDVTVRTIEFTTPSTATYVAFSCKIINKEKLKVHEGEFIYKNILKQDTTQVPYKCVIGNAGNPHVVTVGSEKDFTSLRTALDSITDATEYNRYLVLFYGDGNPYDVKSDFTSAEIEAADTSTIGIRVPPFTTLFGVGGKEKCILSASFDTAVREFSTLNLYSSSSLIGFTVICDKARYAVHDDWYDSAVENDFNVDRIIADCDLIATNPRYYMPYGSGIRSGRTWKYKNVLFKNNTSGMRAYSVHNNVGYTTPAYIEFENCIFDAPLLDSVIAFQTLTDPIVNTALFKGCKMTSGGKISCFESTSGSNTGCAWKVTGYANAFNNDDITISTSDGVDYSSRKDLI